MAGLPQKLFRLGQIFLGDVDLAGTEPLDGLVAQGEFDPAVAEDRRYPFKIDTVYRVLKSDHSFTSFADLFHGFILTRRPLPGHPGGAEVRSAAKRGWDSPGKCLK